MATAKKTAALFLLLLFTFYYVNITCFPHGHHVGSFTIIHSHLYTGTADSGEPTHSHTTEVFTIISDLSLFLTVAAFFFGFFVLLKAIREIHQPRISLPVHLQALLPFTPDRAPPVR